MDCRKRLSLLCCTIFGMTVLAVGAMGILATPASAQDQVPYFCNGSSGTTCNVFQLDGSTAPVANANTCVGASPFGPGGSPNTTTPEFGCSAAEQDPVWPADWDALLYPNLVGTSSPVSIISGTPPGPYVFSTPWGSFGAFSGVIPSTLITTGTSTILKQGSKNSNDISTWVVAQQNSPPKDAYLAGAIASYVAPSVAKGGVAFYAGHELVYLGSTRFAPNGSATVGIWFFQQNVAVCANGTQLCVGGTTTLANHQNNDVFLFLTYSGSGTATIQAAEWQCSTSSGNICSPAGSGSLGPSTTITACPSTSDTGCAVTNAASFITLAKSTTEFQAPGEGFNPVSVNPSKWPGFPNGVVPELQFQETGVDLTSLFPGGAPCFSTVMFASVSSGSSPSTASMKSILLGNFNTCAISASKTCAAGTADVSAGTITYPISGTIENTGGGNTTGLTLTDTFQGSSQLLDSGSLTCTCGPSGCTITNNDCSTVTLSPGGTLTYNATITVSQNGGSDQVTATMAGAGGGSASATSNTATCNPLSFSTGITITKNCGNTTIPGGVILVAQSGLVAVKEGVSGTVAVTGQFPLSNVTVYDCVGASFAPLSGTCPTTALTSCAANGGTLRSTITGPPSTPINAGGSSAWSDTYFPGVAPTCNPYNFNDQVLVTASCTSPFCPCPTVENVANKTCPLCPGPTCQ